VSPYDDIAEDGEPAHVGYGDLDRVNGRRKICRYDERNAVVNTAIANRSRCTVDNFRERGFEVTEDVGVDLARHGARRLTSESDLRIDTDEVHPFDHDALARPYIRNTKARRILQEVTGAATLLDDAIKLRHAIDHNGLALLLEFRREIVSGVQRR
jgi:hypothetical protein